jgi:hypothetical protein
VTARRARYGALAALLAAVVATGAWSAAARPAGLPPATHQCDKIKGCETVTGPWVAVPPQGEVGFLLECQNRAGVIAGVDVLSSSHNVSVSWDGKPGTPIRAGTSTGGWLFFRAVSTDGRWQLFQPYLGCIPPPKTGARSTLSALITRPTTTLDRWKTNARVSPGAKTVAATACGKKTEHLIGGWQAIAFQPFNPAAAPDPNLAAKVHVVLTVGDTRATAAISAARGLPLIAAPQVQVGAVCAA